MKRKGRSGFNFSITDYIEFEISIEVKGYSPTNPGNNSANPEAYDPGDAADWSDIKMFFVLKKHIWEKFPEGYKRKVSENILVPVPEPMISILLEEHGIEENIVKEGDEQAYYDYREDRDDDRDEYWRDK